METPRTYRLYLVTKPNGEFHSAYHSKRELKRVFGIDSDKYALIMRTPTHLFFGGDQMLVLTVKEIQ
jgi:hypothetical protein